MAIDIGTAIINLALGTSQFHDELKKVRTDLAGLGSSIKSLASLAGISLSVAGIVQLGKETMHAADAMNTMAKRTGIATESLQRLQLAAAKTGLDVGSVDAGLFRFQRALEEAIMAPGSKAAETFERLGVDISSSTDPMKALAQASEGFKQGLGGLHDATTLFARGARLWLPLLKGGAEGFDEAAKEAERAGAVVSQQVIDPVVKLSEELTQLSKVLMVDLIQGLSAATPELISFAQTIGWMLKAWGDWQRRGLPSAKKSTLSLEDQLKENQEQIDAIKQQSAAQGALESLGRLGVGAFNLGMKGIGKPGDPFAMQTSPWTPSQEIERLQAENDEIKKILEERRGIEQAADEQRARDREARAEAEKSKVLPKKAIEELAQFDVEIAQMQATFAALATSEGKAREVFADVTAGMDQQRKASQALTTAEIALARAKAETARIEAQTTSTNYIDLRVKKEMITATEAHAVAMAKERGQQRERELAAQRRAALAEEMAPEAQFAVTGDAVIRAHMKMEQAAKRVQAAFLEGAEATKEAQAAYQDAAAVWTSTVVEESTRKNARAFGVYGDLVGEASANVADLRKQIDALNAAPMTANLVTRQDLVSKLQGAMVVESQERITEALALNAKWFTISGDAAAQAAADVAAYETEIRRIQAAKPSMPVPAELLAKLQTGLETKSVTAFDAAISSAAATFDVMGDAVARADATVSAWRTRLAAAVAFEERFKVSTVEAADAARGLNDALTDAATTRATQTFKEIADLAKIMGPDFDSAARGLDTLIAKWNTLAKRPGGLSAEEVKQANRELQAARQAASDEAFLRGMRDVRAERAITRGTSPLASMTAEIEVARKSALDAQKEMEKGGAGVQARLAAALDTLTRLQDQFSMAVIGDALRAAAVEAAAFGQSFSNLDAVQVEFDQLTVAIQAMARAGQENEAIYAAMVARWRDLKPLVDFKRQIDQIADAFGSVLVGAISQTSEALTELMMTGKANFRELAQSIIRDIIRMTIQLSIMLAVQMALKAAGGGEGGISTQIGRLLTSTSGPAGGGGGGTADILREGRAAGGITRGPSMQLVGEAGPEAIIPLTKMNQYAGGGGVAVSVEVINQTGTPVSQETERRTGPGGEQMLRVWLRKEVNAALGDGSTDTTLSAAFGIKRKGTAR